MCVCMSVLFLLLYSTELFIQIVICSFINILSMLFIMSKKKCFSIIRFNVVIFFILITFFEQVNIIHIRKCLQNIVVIVLSLMSNKRVSVILECHRFPAYQCGRGARVCECVRAKALVIRRDVNDVNYV